TGTSFQSFSRCVGGAGSVIRGSRPADSRALSHRESPGAARREQDAAIVLLATASGLRCSELLALRFNDLNFTASTIRVEEVSGRRSRGKSGSARTQPPIATWSSWTRMAG